MPNHSVLAILCKFPAGATRDAGWHTLPHRGLTLTQAGTTATVAGLDPVEVLLGRFRVQARNTSGRLLPTSPPTAKA